MPTDTVQRFAHSPQLQQIGGKMVASRFETVQDVIDPSTGTVLTSVAIGAEEEVHLAMACAAIAFSKRGKTPSRERAVHLQRLADMLEECKMDLAQIESLDVGNTSCTSGCCSKTGAIE